MGEKRFNGLYFKNPGRLFFLLAFYSLLHKLIQFNFQEAQTIASVENCQDLTELVFQI